MAIFRFEVVLEISMCADVVSSGPLSFSVSWKKFICAAACGLRKVFAVSSVFTALIASS